MSRSDWKIDYNSPQSFHNFIEKLDLTCEDNRFLAVFGTAFFLGFAISSGIVP
jgi:hypothetical protein